jgi:hypothetical protein
VVTASPAGYTTRLSSEVREETVGAARVAVRTTYWELAWSPVAGAADYLVFLHTSEGASQPPTAVPTPRFRLSVARMLADEPTSTTTTHLALTATHLAVRVAARFPDGTVGPASALFPVGRTETGDVIR